MLLIGLQGLMIDGHAWAERARLEADIAEPLGLTFTLLDSRPKNWPACKPVGDERFDRWSRAVSDLCCGLGERCVLIGHSDGATMALRLAADKRLAEFVEGVVSYAGVFDHFMQGVWRRVRGNMSPSLFLNNEDDRLVPVDNARTLSLHWSFHGPATLKVVLAPDEFLIASLAHAWRPDVANETIRDWVHELMGFIE